MVFSGLKLIIFEVFSQNGDQNSILTYSCYIKFNQCKKTLSFDVDISKVRIINDFLPPIAAF